MTIRTVKASAAVFLFVFAIMAVALLTDIESVTVGSENADVILSFIQVVALALPAVAIFTQALLEYSHKRANEGGKSGGVGSYGPEEYRFGVIFAAFGSSLLMIVGLVVLISALDVPTQVEIGALLILMGLIIIPWTLAVATRNIARDF